MLDVWLATALTRIYPTSRPRRGPSPTYEVARGERFGCQLAYRSGSAPEVVELRADPPDGFDVTVRRVGFVPVRHLNVETPEADLDGVGMLPGLAPDPLFPDSTAHVGSFETGAFWISVRPDCELPPGDYALPLTLSAGSGDRTTCTLDITVRSTRLGPRNDFPVNHIVHADALCDYYGVQPFDEPYWTIMRPYLRDYVDHGMDATFVPLITPPLDGVKRPIQLLGVRRVGDGYEFDWTQVKRWVRLAKEYGIRVFEWSHLFTQWGARHPARVYEGHGETETPLWADDLPITAPAFRTFLDQLMPRLRQLLAEEDILEHSLFHISDEPEKEHLDNYRAARDVLREVAPWATVAESLSEPDFAAAGLVDIPVPQLSAAPEFARRGIEAWTYYCCVPRGRYVNRFLDTPLIKVRMTGWLLYALRARGFVHWGYNYWYRAGTRQLIDPYTVNDAGNWPQWGPGDPFVVYPGADGPVDSIRWEVFAESLQDMALLQAAAPIARLDLQALKDYQDFPRDPDWITRRRREILDALDETSD